MSEGCAGGGALPDAVTTIVAMIVVVIAIGATDGVVVGVGG